MNACSIKKIIKSSEQKRVPQPLGKEPVEKNVTSSKSAPLIEMSMDLGHGSWLLSAWLPIAGQLEKLPEALMEIGLRGQRARDTESPPYALRCQVLQSSQVSHVAQDTMDFPWANSFPS